MLTIDWAGERLELLAERAVFRAATGSLLVADLHLGKPDAFRRAGVPVPGAVTDATLERVTRAVARTGARRLIVLGDLLHARSGRSRDLDLAFARWRRRHEALEVLLVRGNHDRAAGDPPGSWGVACVDEPHADAGWVLCHDAPPAEVVRDGAPAGPRVSGHVHPVVVLRDRDGFRSRRPCFVAGPDGLLLPAAGAFTGGHAVRAAPGERVFVASGDAGDDVVVDVTAAVRRRRGPFAVPRGEA